MNNHYLLYEFGENYNDPNAADIKIYRFAVGANLVIRDTQDRFALIAYEPHAWKTWFPFFLSYKGSLIETRVSSIRPKETAREVVDSLGGKFRLQEDLKTSLINECSEARDVEVGCPKENLSVEVKFSKTSSEWTLYIQLFFESAFRIDPETFRYNAWPVAFLSETEIIKSAPSDLPNGFPIVDNFRRFLEFKRSFKE